MTPGFPENADMAYTFEGPVIGPPIVILLAEGARAGIRADRNKSLRHALASQDYAAQDEFTSELTNALRAGGYKITSVPIARNTADFIEKYPTRNAANVDALLDVVVTGYGYRILGVGHSGPCAPYFKLRARLISTQTSSVLMQEPLSYGTTLPEKGIIAIPDNPQTATLAHCFDELNGQPGPAVYGLRAATKASAEAVAGLLR
ncbi:MAG: hypothetical protein JO157_01070 [Acetobacteraceae bacterium]|nr:hypothetical protein [Acetobacteraceae bacterium]